VSLTANWDAIQADAVATMSRYVQFDTTNPPGNELPAAEWLRDQLRDRGITRDVTIHEPAAGRGLVVGRIAGREPLKPLLINHHIDVVGADPAQWTHPPFSGAVAEGFVWGRGTLDTKNLGVVFLLALDSLLKEGVRFRRPIIFLAVPDEEARGHAGMRWLTERHLAELDPEWVWDEGSGGLHGMFGERTMFGIAVAEKRPHNVRLIASGEPGHGSMPHANNAVVTLAAALERLRRAPRPLHTNAVTAGMFRALAGAQKFPASFFLRHLDQPAILRLLSGRLSADRLMGAVLRDTISPTILRGLQNQRHPGARRGGVGLPVVARNRRRGVHPLARSRDRRQARARGSRRRRAALRGRADGWPILRGRPAGGDGARAGRGLVPAPGAGRDRRPLFPPARLRGLRLRPGHPGAGRSRPRAWD